MEKDLYFRSLFTTKVNFRDFGVTWYASAEFTVVRKDWVCKDRNFSVNPP